MENMVPRTRLISAIDICYKYMGLILKQPSAWIPIVMSLAILTMVLGIITISGVVYHEDEGTAAHIFQIWLVLEVFMIAFFAIKWLPRAPRQALSVLALQIAAALAACAPVFLLGLARD